MRLLSMSSFDRQIHAEIVIISESKGDEGWGHG